MSAQRAVPLLFKHSGWPGCIQKRGAFSPGGWLIVFPTRRWSCCCSTNITILSWGRRESGEETLTFLPPFCLAGKFLGLSFYLYFLPLTNQSAGAAQLSLCHIASPKSFTFGRRSQTFPCSLDRDADASSPTFWERSNYSAPAKNHRRTRHARTYIRTHARMGKKKKKEQLFNIITQAYAFAHISARGPRRQSSLN